MVRSLRYVFLTFAPTVASVGSVSASAQTATHSATAFPPAAGSVAAMDRMADMEDCNGETMPDCAKACQAACLSGVPAGIQNEEPAQVSFTNESRARPPFDREVSYPAQANEPPPPRL